MASTAMLRLMAFCESRQELHDKAFVFCSRFVSKIYSFDLLSSIFYTVFFRGKTDANLTINLQLPTHSYVNNLKFFFRLFMLREKQPFISGRLLMNLFVGARQCSRLLMCIKIGGG